MWSQYSTGKTKEKTCSLCKQCGQEESTTHVQNCQAPNVKFLWHNAIAKLEQWLQDSLTDPDITTHITTRLLDWYNGQENGDDVSFIPVTEQNMIGWAYVIEGWICKSWRYKQAQSLQQINSAKSSLRWATALIQKLWDIAWDLWEHCNDIEHLNDIQEQHLKLNAEFDLIIDNFDIHS